MTIIGSYVSLAQVVHHQNIWHSASPHPRELLCSSWENEDFSKKEWVCGRGGGGQSQPNILSFSLQMLIVLFGSSGFSFLISPLSFFSFISGSIEPIQPPTHPPGTKLKQWNFSTTIIIFIIHVPSSVLDNAPRDRQRKLTKNLGNLNFC